MDEKIKMKRALYEMSDDRERDDMAVSEIMDLNSQYRKLDTSLFVLKQNMDGISKELKSGAKHEDIASMLEVMADGVGKIRSDYSSESKETAKAVRETQRELIKTVKDLRGIFEIGAQGSNINKNAGPLYKTMINHLSGMETAFKNWKYPQYASVSVRNKNFANINPSIDERATALGDTSKNVTTAGSRVQFYAASTPCNRVIITAKETNTGKVWIGSSTIASGRGIPLNQGFSATLMVSDANLVYMDADTNGDGAYIYYEA